MPPLPRLSPEVVWDRGGAALYAGDCLDVLPALAGTADLIFADPPFNIGYEYDVHDDNMDDVAYAAWAGRWLSLLRRTATPTASFFLASGLRWQAELKVLAGQNGWHWRDTICWHYTFGPRQRSKFTPSWVALHYFTASPNEWTWNSAEVLVPSARQLKYNDRRAVAAGKTPDNVWVLLPSETAGCFSPGDNAWLESRVCGTFKERTGHPCQMPLAVLERIVRVASNPGDLVLDPFVGSGTSVEAAAKLGRRSVGIDLSRSYLLEYCVPRLEKWL